VFVHDVLVLVPLLVSLATAVSSAYAFVALDWKPLPSPPLSGAFATALRKPGTVPPPPPPAGGVSVRLAERVALPSEAVTVAV
jgi:hypothetical protein